MLYDKINIYLKWYTIKLTFSDNGIRLNLHLVEMVYDKINI